METSSDLETLDSDGETSQEVSPSESPPEEDVVIAAEDASVEYTYENATEDPMNSPMDREDFERRVTNLLELMQNDPSVRDRVLAEIYVNMASAEMGIRGVFESIQTGGMAGMMKGVFRRGN